MRNGFLVIDKPAGMTSARVVGKIKHVLYLNGEKDTKIGHFGTLDPDGTGVLPIALGRATRLFAYQDGKQKVYLTEFEFGVLTDTLDRSGKVLQTSEKIPTLTEVELAAESMVGKYLQIPPAYSAKFIDGKRAYELARKGEIFDLKPKAIEIFGFNGIKETERGSFQMTIEVSSGTYIRSIARDMGAKLGTYGTMKNIRRMKSGVFDIEDAVAPDDLKPEDLDRRTIPVDRFLEDMPRVDVPSELSKILLTGTPLYGLDLPEISFRAYLDGELIGIAEKTDTGLLRIKTWLR